MSRPLRFIPPGGAVVEITYRTQHRRFLLKPGPKFNKIVVGALARAKRRHQVKLYGCVVMSNHLHLLIGVNDARQTAGFMNLFGSKLAKEVARCTGWRENIWSRRYQAIVVSDEEEAQVSRLRYLLAHGSKEGLVHHPREWPGTHCVRPLVSGSSLTGVWFNRSKENTSRDRKKSEQDSSFAEKEILTFDTLPCWRHLSKAEILERIADLVAQIAFEGQRENQKKRRVVLGAQKICQQHPHDMPVPTMPTPAPRFHAATKHMREALAEGYRAFSVAFFAASEKLRTSMGPADFPPGSFPPNFPFVEAATVEFENV